MGVESPRVSGLRSGRVAAVTVDQDVIHIVPKHFFFFHFKNLSTVSTPALPPFLNLGLCICPTGRNSPLCLLARRTHLLRLQRNRQYLPGLCIPDFRSRVEASVEDPAGVAAGDEPVCVGAGAASELDVVFEGWEPAMSLIDRRVVC